MRKKTKNTFLKTIGGMMLAILILTIFMQISASAQDIIEQQIEEQTEGILFPPSSNRRALEGTWDSRITIRVCANNMEIRTFPVMHSFVRGGTMAHTSTDVAPNLRTSGLGVWNHLTGMKYRFKFKSFNFDPGGNFTGWTIITQEADLNRSTTAYTSAGTADVYNPNGNPIFTGCSSTTATRFE